MRLVLDTNVMVSALLWQGTPYRLLQAIRQEPGIRLYSSSALLDELADVLTRSFASRRLALLGKTAHDVLADFSDVIEPVEPGEVARVVPTDPDDDQVIAAALAAGADCIVSGDSDLLALVAFQGIAPRWPPQTAPLMATQTAPGRTVRLCRMSRSIAGG